jgi:hypothetical protein
MIFTIGKYKNFHADRLPCEQPFTDPIAANHSDSSSKQNTDITVEVRLNVCHKAGLKCTLNK